MELSLAYYDSQLGSCVLWTRAECIWEYNVGTSWLGLYLCVQKKNVCLLYATYVVMGGGWKKQKKR